MHDTSVINMPTKANTLKVILEGVPSAVISFSFMEMDRQTRVETDGRVFTLRKRILGIGTILPLLVFKCIVYFSILPWL